MENVLKNLTGAMLQEQRPDLFREIFDLGRKAERDGIDTLAAMSQFSGDPNTSKGSTMSTDEQSWRNEFAASPELQSQYKLGGVESYVSFKKAESEGKVTITELNVIK